MARPFAGLPHLIYAATHPSAFSRVSEESDFVGVGQSARDEIVPAISALLECMLTGVSNKLSSLMLALFSGNLVTTQDPYGSIDQL